MNALTRYKPKPLPRINVPKKLAPKVAAPKIPVPGKHAASY